MNIWENLPFTDIKKKQIFNEQIQINTKNDTLFRTIDFINIHCNTFKTIQCYKNSVVL